MLHVFAPLPLARLLARSAAPIRAFLVLVLAAGTVAAAVCLLAGLAQAAEVIPAWLLLAGFAVGGVQVYRPPGR